MIYGKTNTKKIKSKIEWGGRWEGCSRAGGRGICIPVTHADVWQKPTQYHKPNIPQLKSIKNKSKKKLGLKLSIQKTKIMAFGPITSWEIDGETVADFIFLGSKITADGDCSHKVKRRLLLGRKIITNLDSILKSRDITLPTKIYRKLWFFQWSCMDGRVEL